MRKSVILAICVLTVCSCRPSGNHIAASLSVPNVPVLALKSSNCVATLLLSRTDTVPCTLEKVTVNLTGTENLSDVTTLSVFYGKRSLGNTHVHIRKGTRSRRIVIPIDYTVTDDSTELSLYMSLKDTIDLRNKLLINQVTVATTLGKAVVVDSSQTALRTGLALRREMQDGVNTSRIPGLTTTPSGTLIALYDARWESDTDLQGDIDLCINRSTDGGRTWSGMQKVQDMGTWGGLPQRYNGVSDGCILADAQTGDLYVAGLWMHGVLDPENGKWIEGLDNNSTVWNHQWRSFGSQPGYSVKQSSQFLLSKSTDDGLTWSDPINITTMVKPESWWLMAPAPGHGITLQDGTLVFPAEGRTENGLQISTLIYSKDHGQSWQSGNPAYTNTNECMAVQLADGSIMLNMRERSNRGLDKGNGRAIAVTADLGQTWTEHATSRNALIEPACMAALHKHTCTDTDGNIRELLFFFNPNSKTQRNHFTLKCSLDQGETWPRELWLPIDESNGNGYSCITSIDQNTLGILYEGSGANLVFLTVSLDEVLN